MNFKFNVNKETVRFGMDPSESVNFRFQNEEQPPAAEVLPDTSGIIAEFDKLSIGSDGASWLNKIADGNDILFSNGTLSIKHNAVYIPVNCYGELQMIEEPNTVYAFFKGDYINAWKPIISKGMTGDYRCYGFDIWTNNDDLYVTANSNDYSLRQNPAAYHLIAYTRNENGVTTIFLNGKKLGNAAEFFSGNYSGFYYISTARRGENVSYHTDEQLAANCDAILEKYS